MKKASEWFVKYGGWAWKIILIATVCATWWMQIKFTMKEEFTDFKRKYWENYGRQQQENAQTDKRLSLLQQRIEMMENMDHAR